MLGKNRIHKFITSLTVIAVTCVYSTIAFAAPKDINGEIIVTGQVTVNKQPAVSNSTIVSGSTITTGTNSSAVINLGKNGKVELLSDTSINLKFTDSSINVMLTMGKIRVLNSAGISAKVNTRNATVVADTGQTNSFAVDAGCSDDIRCTQTFVETTSGLVTLRNGSNVKQVAAGADATAGNPSQTGCKPCKRPGGTAPTPIAGIGSGALAALLIGAGAAAFLAMYLGRNTDVSTDGDAAIISPVR